jgi:hypothetical protein
MPTPCKINIDSGTPLVINTSNPTVLVQGTCGSAKPIRLKRVRFTSNNTGASQQIVVIQFVFYASGTAGGTTVAATPVNQGITYTPATLFKVNTTTLGTTPTVQWSDQWNTANPYDLTEGLLELQDEIPAAKAWAFLITPAPASAVSVSGDINFEEFG